MIFRTFEVSCEGVKLISVVAGGKGSDETAGAFERIGINEREWLGHIGAGAKDDLDAPKMSMLVMGSGQHVTEGKASSCGVL
ncbi:hypothetical protein GCM10008961_38480 [Deinococcus knuensis]|uniref:Uncharacterized protein n=1 Tax=Deinococcus knuensis TaxID=1837380 RepID=A0ABQ2SZV9_9DEIO|nr:hypothetical protein GCM10008961_38480 [Deinococcus knuensis]